MKRILIGAAAFTLGTLAFAVPAQAAPGDDFWVANDGSKIVSSTTVELKGNNTSVETTKAFPELTVEKDAVLSFKYTLDDGAKCIGGGPRVFVVIDGTNVNTWDQNIPDGVDAACEGKAVLPAGKVTAAGVVYDNSVGGTVTVTDVKIGGTTVDFKAYEIKTLAEIKAPTATDPTCEVAGTVKLPTEAEQVGVKYTAKRNVENDVTMSATVTAEAKFGYRIADGVKTEWTFPIAKLTGEKCTPTTPPTTTPPAPTEVTITEAPKVGKVDCENFQVLYPSVAGVNWDIPDNSIAVDGDTVTFKVVATAKEGYVLKGTTEWTLTFKIPANCDATPAPTEVPTSPAAGGGLPVTGPGGGTNVPLIAGLSGTAMFFLGGALLLWMRRRRDNVAFVA